ncbi:MAG: hypothetical protein JNL66_16085 [Alphaproteobacteria bacterium]|nr:hypothetical protein [Alphaproteobacteria bacterium]
MLRPPCPMVSRLDRNGGRSAAGQRVSEFETTFREDDTERDPCPSYKFRAAFAVARKNVPRVRACDGDDVLRRLRMARHWHNNRRKRETPFWLLKLLVPAVHEEIEQ